jgi:hypothetical protein
MSTTIEANPEATRDMMLADLGIMEESIRHNEDTGEKRFNFFITLVTAVVGGVVALHTAEGKPGGLPAGVGDVDWLASLGLLVFGLLSFRRMMHRDRVTEQYKEITDYIRRRYREIYTPAHDTLGDYRVPDLIRPPDGRTRLQKRLRRILQGGYTPTLALLNGCLLTMTLWLAHAVRSDAAVLLGMLLAAVLCIAGSAPRKKKAA